MSQNKPFKVVIVGGSVAGLAMANMLQANNIDYILLEAYPTIAPQVGASIGLLPHGNRILDQLGVFDKLMNFSRPIDTFTFRNARGKPIAACRDIKRHGFPILFLDRQKLLEVLYDNIHDKTKILSNKRVVQVQTSDRGSAAVTSDGETYPGDILIGADGIHSTVRNEMWKLANKLEPGSVDTSEAESVHCDYSCIFGISSSCPGVKAGDMNSVFRDRASYLIIGGLNGRTYWFRFQKFPKRLFGSQIPRFTDVETQETIKSALHEDILPGVKFSKLIENQVSGSMTPLVEHVYKKWHFGRVTTVGDSCHKFHPIGGHGGNAAIETAATLTNLLVESLKRSSTGRLTTLQVDGVFRRVQELRQDRAIAVKTYSHEQQRTESLDNWFRKLTAFYLLPLVDNEDVTFNFSCQIPASEKLDMLPVDRQERLVPFKDELLSDPRGRGPIKWLLIGFYVFLAACVYYGMWVFPSKWGLDPAIGEVLTSGTFEHETSFNLVRSYTGITLVDQYFVFLSIIFMPGIRNYDPSFRMFQIYFLGLIGQPIVVWTIESYRKRNAVTLLAIPSIWFALFQSTGIGFFMPLYYAVYTYISENEPYWWPLRRAVPVNYAKVLLLAGLVGYFVPTILMFYPWSNSEVAQYMETFWQPSPLYVPVLTLALGKLVGRQDSRDTEASGDVPFLKQIYLVMAVLGVCVHWGVILSVFGHETLSFSSVFVPNVLLSPMPLASAFHNIFLVDFWGFLLASYVWCVSAVWDLSRVGRATVGITDAACILLAAHLLLGPGAAMAVVWYWREEVMAIRSFVAPVKSRKGGKDM
ncbi:hypothetical protein NW762_012794 [Fusarium torreyae]|uniref:FAD-binding domain-containing protein n=1 Tax=Fusarium torreyae TaxID=1237075 RepID=A0A9W8VB58_9HYPO|nr:hypothetical protein NW762_012794 [Fusarium torreyae]